MTPKVTVFTCYHDEHFMLPWFWDHYSYADSIVVTATGRGYLDLMNRRVPTNVSVVLQPNSETLDEFKLTEIRNTVARTIKDDSWAVLVDFDQLVVHPNLPRLLNDDWIVGLCAAGYLMHTDTPDTLDPSKPLVEQVTDGVYDKWCSCLVAFRPAYLTPNYGPGRHAAFPETLFGCVSSDIDLSIRHFQLFGTEAQIESRWKERAAAQSKANVENGFAGHYARGASDKLAWVRRYKHVV